MTACILLLKIPQMYVRVYLKTNIIIVWMIWKKKKK